jgi:predicted nucleotidyltransferase
MPIALFNSAGDLPVGIHQATLEEVLERFGTENPQRRRLAQRLRRIFTFATETGQLARFIVFGSFITSKTEPNDIDVFLIMEDDFEMEQLTSEAKLIFDHMGAESYEGASIFWIRRMAALGGEEAMMAHWQIKRDRGKRGVIEIVESAGGV